jgi:hypothetical protein
MKIMKAMKTMKNNPAKPFRSSMIFMPFMFCFAQSN